MAVVNVLKWNASPTVLAWKHPSESLDTWSQLIVSESQEAYLLQEGQFVGPFGPGRHVLDTNNYPVLTSFITKLVSKGRSPFTAEVWYIQKAFSLDIKWGTSDAILLEDPRYRIILPVRAFGRYGIQVENSALFLSKMVGTLPAYTTKTLSEHFKGVLVTLVKDTIAKYIIDKDISILKLSTYISELSQVLEEQLAQKLRIYGVAICNFAINSISTDEHDPAVARLRQALAQRAELDILGVDYSRKRSFDIMETAAANQAGGAVQSSFLGAGLGMAMGVGMGNAMGQASASLAANVTPNQSVCPNCRTLNSPQDKFCCGCGAALAQTPPPSGRFCPNCGSPITPAHQFCPNCGSKLQ